MKKEYSSPEVSITVIKEEDIKMRSGIKVGEGTQSSNFQTLSINL